ncbi:hypothetical protein Ae263Ps1_1593c [Pseudonocardia sp. Ae263_Ps1]|nr:hypothetical protein Ae150APs1_3731 [Pseudonocardia sp. Ae150A_Ps1]OLL84538.1 hypothetical protein Ae263Ps1_1593c [Pseudonocardia sp. Ae263_Ps1]OLL95443.1 hypothetical protein Ae356Ps1_5340 [Pseudonocardia sp. Ae356_Ps1]
MFRPCRTRSWSIVDEIFRPLVRGRGSAAPRRLPAG